MVQTEMKEMIDAVVTDNTGVMVGGLARCSHESI